MAAIALLDTKNGSVEVCNVAPYMLSERLRNHKREAITGSRVAGASIFFTEKLSVAHYIGKERASERHYSNWVLRNRATGPILPTVRIRFFRPRHTVSFHIGRQAAVA